MLELESLVFKVDTSQLTEAAAKLKELGVEVSNLSKPIGKLTKDQMQAAKQEQILARERAKTAEATAKAAKAEAAAEGATARAAAAQTKAQKTTSALTTVTKEQQTVLERQKAVLDFMTQGMSKGQATTLAYAQATGAATQELNELVGVLQTQRKLQGGDPFDKSTSGLTALRNRLTEVREANRLYTAGIQLTRDQTRELARDKERIIERIKAEAAQNGNLKVSLSEIKAALIEHNIAYIKTASQVNNLINAEKELERQHRDSANAVRALAREEEKVDGMVNALTGSVGHNTKTSERAAEAIARYARNLRLAGVSGAEAATRLKAYEDRVRRIQSMEEKRKVDLLSRSLAPQISDVTVSLAGGMNPLTVLLQQGLQVRDLIGQSGVEAAQLQKAFRSAASDMVSSIKGTAAALGSLFIGTIVDAGKATLNFATSTLVAGKSLDGMRNKMLAMNGLMGETPKLVRVFDMAVKGLSIAAGAMFVTAIVSAGAFLLALKRVISENNALARSLVLTGNSLSLTVAQANEVASSFNQVGISTGSALKVITAMAKEGGFTASAIYGLTKAAVDLEKYGGVAIEETVKSFAKMRDDPVKGMIELAKSTGMVSPEIIKLVIELQKQGKTAEAVAVAMEELADVNQKQVNRMKDDLNGFSLFMIELGRSIANFFDSTFNDLFRKASPRAALEKQLAAVNDLLNNNAGVSGVLVGGLGLGRETYEKMRADLSKQLLLLDKTTQAEADRTQANIKAAKDREDFLKRENDYVDKNTQKTKDLAQVEKDLARGYITSAQAAARKAEIIEKYKEKNKKTPKTEAEKLEEERISKMNAALSAYGDLLNKNDGFLSDYNEKEAHLNFLLSQKVITQSQYNEVFAELLKKQPIVAEYLAKEFEYRENIRNSLIEEIKLRDILMFDTLEQSDKLNKELAEESEELQYQASLLGLTATERQKVIKLKQVEVKLNQELKAASAVQDETARLELIAAAYQRHAQRISNINKEISNEAASQWTDGITDAIVTGLFEGGKEGSKKLRDLITAELRKPITVYIQAIVGDIVGGITGSKVGGVASGISKVSDLLSGKTGLGATLSSALGSIGAAATYGTMPLSQQSTMLAAQEAGFDTLSGQLSSLGQSLGNAFSGYSISKMLSNGYKIDGINVNAIAAIASTFFGPIAGVVGGLVNRAFGRKLKNTGVEGKFSNEGFDGNTFQFYKGGWFRSDKTIYQSMDSDTESVLGMQFLQLKAATSVMAAVLNLNADYIKDYTKSISFSTQGMNDAQVQEKLQSVFGDIQEDLAKSLMGTFETTTTKSRWFSVSKTVTKWVAGPFIRIGETATEALTRVYNSLIAVNGVLNLFSMDLMEASLAGGDLSSKLVDLFGTVDDFKNETTAYYDTFFSEQEKATKLIEILTKEFEGMGVTLPSTIQGYRDLVEAQDLTTEEGRATFAALIKLSSGFAQATQAFESFGNAVEEEIARLRGEILQDSVNAYAAMQSQFAITTAAARAGDASALESLPELSKQVESTFLSQAGNAEDVARVRAWLADSLSTTLNVLGIPGFASGGMHTGGARIVGENGPELEVTGPSRIYNASQTASMFDNSELIVELQALREEVVMLRSEVRADVVHNAKTAKLLDRVIPDGDAIQTRVAT
jgi:phage-related minor tail protein